MCIRDRSFSLVQKFSSSTNVFPEHLVEENAVDFNVMCWEPVVKEVWWEHHVISVIPEFYSILSVHLVLLTRFLESASSKNHCGSPDVYKETGVIKRSIWVSEESWSDWSHHSVYSEHAHPEEVYHSECSVESMCTILSLAHFDGFENSSNKSRSGG